MGLPGSERRARVVLDQPAIHRSTKRMAHEIVERNRELQDLALVAIVAGGVPVARLLAEQLREIAGSDVPLGEIDITLYRDDVIAEGHRPIPRTTRIPFSVGGKRVVLVDDVVFTGRTIRAAMDAVIDFGRPEGIQVAALVDRGHRELPIRVDYVGKNLPTSRAEEVILRRTEDGALEVVVV